MKRLIVLGLLLASMQAQAFEIFGYNFGGEAPRDRDEEYRGRRSNTVYSYTPPRGEDDGYGYTRRKKSRERPQERWEGERRRDYDYSAEEKDANSHEVWNEEYLAERNFHLEERLAQADGDPEALHYSREALRIANDALIIHNQIKANIGYQFSKHFLDIATSVTPGVSWARDAYEFLTGKDLLNGEKLHGVERTIAGAGAVAIGFGKHFKLAGEVLSQMTRNSYAAQAIITMVKNRRSYREVVDIFHYFKELKVHPRMGRSYLLGFLPGARLRVLEEDLKVYRYYSETGGNARGFWVSPRKVQNPQEELAIWSSPPYLVEEWTIPKGTKILEGYAAPSKGFQGGAAQIFVNMELLQ